MYGRIVRPDGYGATLVIVDDARARAMPGVSVVRDGDFLGVVAPTERAATRAAAAIQATWERAGRAAVVRRRCSTTSRRIRNARAAAGTRRSRSETSSRPSAARGRSRRAIAFPTSRTCRSSRAPAVAEWQDGKLTVWTGTQRPFGVRTELAEAFRMPEDRVRVIVPDMGSGYGGKHTGEAAIEAARLAKAAKRR